MPRVVPSQIVALIDKMFPAAAEAKGGWNLNPDHQNNLAAIIDMVNQVPAELLTLDADTNSAFISSMAAIRETVLRWRGGHPDQLKKAPGYKDNPVTLIRNALVACSDEAPAPGTAELNFIDDEGLRNNLRIDISSVNRALINGEWKAATVIAGSVCEALLLWRLTKANTGEPEEVLQKWVLHQYIEVAARLKIIRPQTEKQATLAKDFRNLIHPGRATRLAQECNRGTALSAVAAVEHIVEDLKT